MSISNRPVPAEQEALDRPWRVWASIGIGVFILVSVLLGFVLVPLSDAEGRSFIFSICRAIGLPGFQGSSDTSSSSGAPATGQTPSQIVWNTQTRQLIRTGDIERGTTLVTDVCSGCHGQNGLSVDPTMPNLAGQAAEAIFKQLHDYRDGSRQGGQAEIMAGIAQGLDDQQMADVAAYYSAQHPRRIVAATSAVPQPIVDLVQTGDPRRAISSCDSCHGGELTGPEGALTLLGQRPQYLEQQLQLFAAGERGNDLYGRMRTIADKLSPEEMHQIATYYSGIWNLIETSEGE